MEFISWNGVKNDEERKGTVTVCREWKTKLTKKRQENSLMSLVLSFCTRELKGVKELCDSYLQKYSVSPG
jgi:hypothetical protein